MRKIKLLSFAIIAILFSTSCTGQNGIEAIGTDEYVEMEPKEDVLVIDVRTPDEVAQGHIAGADYFINIYDKSFKEKVNALDKDKTYIVYCRSGARSANAIKQMNDMGFKHLYNLTGGIMAWDKGELVK